MCQAKQLTATVRQQSGLSRKQTFGVVWYAVLATLSAWSLCGCGKEQVATRSVSTERVLYSFERQIYSPLYGGTASRAIVAQHATHGQHALRLRFSPGRETIILDTGGFPMDWREWQWLRVDMYREGPPTALNLRLSDAHGKRMWIWNIRVSLGANTLQHDLASLREQIDLSAISELMWYAEQPSGTLYMDAVRLSR
jgi:hypothetical protein